MNQVCKGAVLLGLIATALGSCIGCPECSVPQKYRGVVRLSSDEEVDLLQFPIEEQVEIYLIGMKCVHPPAMHLIDPLASQGLEALPGLLNRLERAETDFERRWLIVVLHRMSLRYHDLSHNEVAISTIERSLNAMEDEYYRDRGSKDLAEIRRLVPREFPGFFSLDGAEMDSVMSNLALEKQLDLYLAAVDWYSMPSPGVFSPPVVHMAQIIARSNDSVFPALRGRFTIASGDSHRTYLIYLLWMMWRERPDFRLDQQQQQWAKSAVDAIEDRRWKEMAKDRLEDLIGSGTKG